MDRSRRSFPAVPYQALWKRDIVRNNSCFRTFAIPLSCAVLRIGRSVKKRKWTPPLSRQSRAKLAASAWILRPTCASYCRAALLRFGARGFYLTDGRILSFLSDSSVHFIVSRHDFVVRIEPVTRPESYLAEKSPAFSRAGRPVFDPPHPGTRLLTHAAGANGGRSDVSRPLFARLASALRHSGSSPKDRTKWGPSDRSEYQAFCRLRRRQSTKANRQTMAGDFPETVRDLNGALAGGKSEMFGFRGTNWRFFSTIGSRSAVSANPRAPANAWRLEVIAKASSFWRSPTSFV